VGHKDLLCSSETIKQICTKFNFFSSSFAPHILYHMTTTQQKEKEENKEEEEEDAMVSWDPKVLDQCLLFTLHLRLSFPPQRIWANFLRDSKNPFWRNFEWFCITVLKESDWISRKKKINKWGSREVGLDRSRSGLEMVMVTMKMV